MKLIDCIKDVRHVEEEIFDAIKALPAHVLLWGGRGNCMVYFDVLTFTWHTDSGHI